MNTLIRTSLILTLVLMVVLVGRMHKERFHSSHTARVAMVPEDNSLAHHPVSQHPSGREPSIIDISPTPPEPPPTTPSICTNCLQILSRLTPEQLENLNSTYNGVYYTTPTPTH